MLCTLEEIINDKLTPAGFELRRATHLLTNDMETILSNLETPDYIRLLLECPNHYLSGLVITVPPVWVKKTGEPIRCIDSLTGYEFRLCSFDCADIESIYPLEITLESGVAEELSNRQNKELTYVTVARDKSELEKVIKDIINTRRVQRIFQQIGEAIFESEQ